jgi:hypothetical protein
LICRSLFQAHSWAPFNVTESGFRKIATALKIRPSFLEVLHTFGHPKAGHETEPFLGTFDIYFPPLGMGSDPSERKTFGQSTTTTPLYVLKSLIEISYNACHCVRTGREAWPWSVRKVGVYHRYSHASKSSTWVFLQPTAAIRRTIGAVSSASRLTPVMVHNTLLRITSQTWKPYLQDLDDEIRKEVSLSHKLSHDIVSYLTSLTFRAEKRVSMHL